MNIYLMLAILVANAIAIAIVYQFIKKLPKKDKIIFIAISVAAIYILLTIVYWFSGFGIDKKIHEVSKNFITYVFVPINVILFIPFIASNYIKLKNKKIKKEKFIKRIILVVLVLIVVLVIEYFYFKSIQQNINVINSQMNLNNVKNSQTNEIDTKIENQIVNKTTTNIITNVQTNVMTNNIKNSQSNTITNNI